MRRLALLLALALAAPAFAQVPDAPPAAPSPDLARAKELFENGSRLYDEGLYEDAIVAFQEAYKLSDKPGLLFNIANCYERLGKLQEALDSLNRYRAFAAADERESLDRRISTMERRLAEQKAAAAVVPAPVEVPTTPIIQITPTEPAKRSKMRSAPLAITGGGIVAVGAATAIATFATSRSYVEDGDYERYAGLRPINNIAVGASVAGAGLFLVGVLPGAKSADVGVTFSGEF